MVSLSLAELRDPAVMAERLAATGWQVREVEPGHGRHKPGETTIIALRITTGPGKVTWGYVRWCEDRSVADSIHAKALARRPRPGSAGPGLARLDERTVFYALPNDGRLRRLRHYVLADKLAHSLKDLISSDESTAVSADIAVLRYKPERRLIARVELSGGGPPRRLLLRATTRRHATDLAALARHLRSNGVMTAAPVAKLEDDRVSIDEFVADATVLLEALGRPNRPGCTGGTGGTGGHDRPAEADAEELASALHRLHSVAPGPTTTRRPDDLAQVAVELAQLARRSPELGMPIAALVDALDAAPESAEVLLHGDLHANNILLSPSGPVFIDLDDVAVGPVSVDLGWLLAHAYATEIRQPDLADGPVTFAQDVIAHYRELTPVDPQALGRSTSLGLARLALRTARHLDPGWSTVAGQMLDLALERLVDRPGT